MAGLLWAALLGTGIAMLWAYENTPSPVVQDVSAWPQQSTLARDSDRPTLVMFIHPQCPCSRASVRELARLQARVRERMAMTVVFVRPPDVEPEWEGTDLRGEVDLIPGVRVMADERNEARLFKARVSGETRLYAPDGRMLFTGGITAARGHEGDNAGREALVSLVTGEGEQTPVRTSVFGCYLFEASANVDHGTAEQE